jgi:hypothetical protein
VGRARLSDCPSVFAMMRESWSHWSKLRVACSAFRWADARGAPFEGGVLERALWRLIGTTRRGEMRWTDDTQMTIDVVESYLAIGAIDADELAIRFARSYRWSRGYGPEAAKVLKRIAAGADWRRPIAPCIGRDCSAMGPRCARL